MTQPCNSVKALKDDTVVRIRVACYFFTSHISVCATAFCLLFNKRISWWWWWWWWWWWLQSSQLRSTSPC